MPDLLDLQMDFQKYLLQQNSSIQKQIMNTENISVETRLGIYRNAYFLRLREALQKNYPVLHALLDEEEFNQLSREYIDLHPSSFRIIRWYGKELNSFLKSTEPYSNHSFLTEMVELEWQLTEIFAAADSVPLPIERMALIPPEKWPDMRFAINPSLRRLNLYWNVVEVWEAHNQEKELAPERSDQVINWMIWRKNFQIQFYALPTDETFMIDSLIKGDTFGSICEGLCEWIEEQKVSMHAALLLKRFVVDGLIIDAIY